MKFTNISASILAAAACGSAVTIALQWAYNKVFNSEENKGKQVKSCRVKRASPKKDDRTSCNTEQGYLPENLAQERMEPKAGTQRCAVAEPQQGAGMPRTVEGQHGIADNSLHLELTDDGLAEASGGEASRETLEKGKALQGEFLNKRSGAKFVETREQGIEATPHTVDKGIATDESGYCTGEEDIVLVDRRLMQFMVHTMVDMEKKLLRYEGSSNEQISLLQQLFQ